LDSASPGGRRRSTHAHDAIIEAALVMLRELGYQQLTMEGVAARAGVAKATVYRWWPSKATLVLEAIRDHLGPPRQATGNTAKDIHDLVQGIIDVIGDLLGEVFIADLARDPDAARQLADLVGPYRAAYAATLLGAASRGDLPYDLDPTTVIDLISGIALFRKLMHRPLDATLTDQLTALILGGQLPRTGGGSGRWPISS
jgi:AcrR family transcriptional regulator